MAANSFDEWYAGSICKGYRPYTADLRECWDAATKAAEARFTSTNMPSAPCPKCGAAMREIVAYMSHQYCPCCDRAMPVTAHVG